MEARRRLLIKAAATVKSCIQRRPAALYNILVRSRQKGELKCGRYEECGWCSLPLNHIFLALQFLRRFLFWVISVSSF
ncbi:hypothetical protein L1887_29990 [Cichorium endivia]|nr:hypothetical protein L1887_29990 [Cichorium endivia]